MKKYIFILFVIILTFSACTKESKNCDIYTFEERINKANNEVNFYFENTFLKDNILYWCPNDNSCVSFYINNSTGNIEKCNVVFRNKKADKVLTNCIKESLFYNNEYMTESNFETEKFLMFTFEDKRYIKEQENQTLKKEIKQEDLY